MIMKIYRYEHPELGAGPYNSACHQLECMGKIHNSSPAHPLPTDDFLLFEMWISETVFFGFDSLDKLNQWFDGFHDIIRDAGYLIFEYDVPPRLVIFGRSGRQVVFKKNKSKFLRSF